MFKQVRNRHDDMRPARRFSTVMIDYRKLVLMTLLAGLMVPMASGKTKLVQSWADPTAGNYHFKKLLTVAVIENADIRRIAERAMVRNIKRIPAVASIELLSEGAGKDVERAKRFLRESGFDGAVILRFVSVNDKTQYVAPTLPDPYLSYWAYNNWAWPITATPGYMRTDRFAQLEMLFFSLTDDKRLYSGVCETSNPESPSKLIDEIAKVVGDELRKKGIVK
jgi:hypothetical protein